MTLNEFLQAIAKIENILAGREFDGSDRAVMVHFDKSQCTAYDCEYIALADDLSIPLVTADKKLLQSFPTIVVSLQEFAD